MYIVQYNRACAKEINEILFTNSMAFIRLCCECNVMFICTQSKKPEVGTSEWNSDIPTAIGKSNKLNIGLQLSDWQHWTY